MTVWCHGSVLRQTLRFRPVAAFFIAAICVTASAFQSRFRCFYNDVANLVHHYCERRRFAICEDHETRVFFGYKDCVREHSVETAAVVYHLYAVIVVNEPAARDTGKVPRRSRPRTVERDLLGKIRLVKIPCLGFADDLLSSNFPPANWVLTHFERSFTDEFNAAAAYEPSTLPR